ncbi:MAG: response regulator [Spirochaetaceae bacterium]|nr:response regulator [Spirochaetaceae bacterium]
MRVLVADDDAANRYIMSRFLARLGIKAALAADGNAALAALEGDAGIELAFLDLSMPGLDGLAVARALRTLEAAEKRSRVVLIALTGADDGTGAMRAGFDDFLQKPVGYTIIEGSIARWRRNP